MNAPQLMVLLACLAGAILIFSGAGLGGELGAAPSAGLEEDMQEVEQEVETFESDQRGVDSIIGLAITATSITATLLGLLLLAPVTLQNLGFPAWIALPLSLPIYVIGALFTVAILRGVGRLL